MDIQQIFSACDCKAVLKGEGGAAGGTFSENKPAQAPTAFLLHLLSLHFWGAGSPQLPKARQLSCAPTSQTELKTKISTRQAEAGCATQHLQLSRAHSYLKPACSLVSKLLARGTNNPVDSAITSPAEQQNWLEGRISWWSLYLSTGQQMIPSAVPYSISFIQACLKCCICGAQLLVSGFNTVLNALHPISRQIYIKAISTDITKLHMLPKLCNM